MLSIEVSGQVLDIPKDFSVSIDLKNPMFNEIGDYTFPFKIPSTPRNKSILGWKSRIESSRSIWEEFSGSILWNGIILFTGQLRAKLCNDTTYEVTLFVERGNFNWEIKNLWLNQMDLGHRFFNTEDEALTFINSCLPLFYPDVELNFPMIANLTYHDPPETNIQLQYYNYVFPDGKIHSLTDQFTDAPQTQLRTIIVPNIYLLHILKKICENLGYTMDDQFFAKQKELKNLVLYNSLNINQSFIFSMNYMYNQLYVPKIKINEFLGELEKFFNCCFFVDSIHRVVRIVGKNDILLHANVMDFSSNISSLTNDIGDQLLGYTLMMSPDSGDALYQAQLDSEKETIDWIKGAFDTMADVPPYPLTWLGDIVYIISEDKWYQLGVANWSIQWLYLPNGPALSDRFYYGPPYDKNKIQTQFSNMFERGGVVECGNAEADEKSITPRLFFVDRANWFGLGTKTKGFTYNTNLSLKYPGSVGLFTKFWKDYLQWMLNDRKYVRIEKQLSFTDLQNFDFSKKYRINEMNYLIDEIQVTLAADQIKMAMLKCYTAF